MADTVPSPEEKFALIASPNFPQWLASTGGSLAFTTYQAGKLFLLGLNSDGQLSVFERTLPRAMGLAVSADGRTLALATDHQIHRFDNVVAAGGWSHDGYDALYSPHAAWVTGDLDVHDVGLGADGRPLFVNTLFACLATVSDGYSFRPLWKPPFVSKLAPEDRCHLNGMAMDGEHPRYVTAVARTDVREGWRDQRGNGGVVLDVESGDTVSENLSMPHSPRLHEGRLWLVNSGTGELGLVDSDSGRFAPVALCPGYGRGLAFAGGHAIVGLSLAREKSAFSGLALDAALAARRVEPRCGLALFDLGSGEMTMWVRLQGVVRELYDVAFIPGIRRPSLIGFRTDEVKRVISIEE